MTPTYVTHLGLSAAPFTKEIADEELWLPTSKATVDAVYKLSPGRRSPIQGPPLPVPKNARFVCGS